MEQNKQLIDSLLSIDQTLDTKHGKLTKRSADKIDTMLIDTFLSKATIDLNDIKRDIFTFMEDCAKKNNLKNLEYAWLRLDDMSIAMAKGIAETKYDFSFNVNNGKDIVGGMIKLLERDDTKIPATKRGSIVAGYDQLKNMFSEMSKYNSKQALQKISFEINVEAFKSMQEILMLDYFGGVVSSKKVFKFREVLVETAVQIDMVGKLIQWVEVAREDIDKAMKKLVAVQTSKELIESGDAKFAEDKIEEAMTLYGTAFDALTMYEDLDCSAIQAKLADCNIKLQNRESVKA